MAGKLPAPRMRRARPKMSALPPLLIESVTPSEKRTKSLDVDRSHYERQQPGGGCNPRQVAEHEEEIEPGRHEREIHEAGKTTKKAQGLKASRLAMTTVSSGSDRLDGSISPSSGRLIWGTSFFCSAGSVAARPQLSRRESSLAGPSGLSSQPTSILGRSRSAKARPAPSRRDQSSGQFDERRTLAGLALSSRSCSRIHGAGWPDRESAAGPSGSAGSPATRRDGDGRWFGRHPRARSTAALRHARRAAADRARSTPSALRRETAAASVGNLFAMSPDPVSGNCNSFPGVPSMSLASRRLPVHQGADLFHGHRAAIAARDVAHCHGAAGLFSRSPATSR